MPLIAFVSPKGGVGKTTIAAHIAAILAQRGYRVLALDLDPQNALRLHLGLAMQDEAGFMAELAQGQGQGQGTPWRNLVRHSPYGPGVLAHGALDPLQVLTLNQRLFNEPAALATPVAEMLADPALVLLADCPPGPTAAFAALLPLVSEMVVVMLADAGSAALLPQVASGRFLGRGTLAARAADRVGVVLNQVDLDSPLSTAVLNAAERSLGPRLLGPVAYDVALAEALANKRLLLDGSGGAAEDLHLLANAIATRARLALPRAAAPAAAPFAALSEWGLQ